ncbi:MAG: biopolymer transporter ExbD [Phycisphaerae bacterium]|nr:biopolymer transporter ExbD [Phycisphaerae bacterium]
MPDVQRQPGSPQRSRPASAVGAEAALPERRPRKRPTHLEQPNLTPMIDVVFNLLIFFLCTGNFNQPEGLLPSRLPKHHGVTSGDELPTTPIRVILRQYGSGEHDYTIQIEQRAERPNDFRELAEALEALRESPAFSADSQVIIVADGNVRWDHLVNAFNAALVARFKNISFGTR